MPVSAAPLSQRSTKLAPSGRLVFAHQDHRKLGPKIDHNEDAVCDYPRCGRSRHKLGKYCVGHALNYSNTGHPTAATVRRSQFAPYVVVATSFVNEQLRAGHPGIEAAVRWLAAELFPQGTVIRRSDPKRPYRGYQAALTRCRRHGVEPVDLLARVIAAELADDRGEVARPLFASDAHRVHQGARLFLYALPHGVAGFSKRRRELGATSSGELVRIGFRVRQYTHDRVNSALGLLACNAATELRRRIAGDFSPNTQHGPVGGSAIPFTNET